VVGGLAAGIADPGSPAGVLLHDEQTAADLQATAASLRAASALLAEDLEAAQHNVLLRGWFKKKERREARAAAEAEAAAEP
jgi:phospholipid/cholesterol/gamma-HCH transport system substrate-binding protein